MRNEAYEYYCGIPGDPGCRAVVVVVAIVQALAPLQQN
jgi:hypothetical protein